MIAAAAAVGLRRRRGLANALLGGAAAFCAVLVIYRPEGAQFYPACPIHQFFGVQCPGCGATRALAALLHGRLAEALHWNALFVVLLPMALVLAGICYRRAMRVGEFRWPEVPRTLIYGMVAGAAVFMIARNLPPWG